MPGDIRNIRGILYRVWTDRIKDSFRKIDNYQTKIKRYARQHDDLDKTSPENRLIEKEELEKMFKLIHRELPANEARAIELRFKHKRNRNEAAKIMGVDPSTVSRYVSVGIKKVRDTFDENKGGNHGNT